MRTLKVLIVVLAMLAISAPSFGYILVYNAYARLKAVDSDANALVGKAMKGYLIVDETNDGEVNDVAWIAYGKDSEGSKTYTLSVPYIELQVDGKYQTVYMDIDEGWFVTTIGRMASKNIGFADRTLVAYTMSGNFTIYDGVVFDMGQMLRGSGNMVITLNSTKTRAANTDGDTIDVVIDDITAALILLGYLE
jgi:hypothetical protein